MDSQLIRTIQPINDKVKAIITGNLIHTDGITISYSDLDVAGAFKITSTDTSDANTHSGTLSADSASYRFGQSVVLTLHDPDLNLSNNLIDVYQVVDDARSPNVDTVGKDDIILFEVLLKDIRYKRCAINGVEHGGLDATGFSLVETGPNTGTFEGSFKMPSQICNRSGTGLISSAGGSLDAKYYDSRDSSGNQNVFSLLKSNNPASYFSSPELSVYDIVKPLSDKVKGVVLSGTVDNPKRGTPISASIVSPDGKIESFGITLSSFGAYQYTIPIYKNSLTGIYDIRLSYANSNLDTVSFTVSDPIIPYWVKTSAKLWALDAISDSEFIAGIAYLHDEGFLVLYDTTFKQKIPSWFKDTARWWADSKISDADFITSIQYLNKVGIIVI